MKAVVAAFNQEKALANRGLLRDYEPLCGSSFQALSATDCALLQVTTPPGQEEADKEEDEQEKICGQTPGGCHHADNAAVCPAGAIMYYLSFHYYRIDKTLSTLLCPLVDKV